MSLIATAPVPPFRLSAFHIAFSVQFPLKPRVDAEGAPVMWKDSDGVEHPALEMGSTSFTGLTVDASGMRGPQLEANEKQFDDSFYVDLAALLNKHLPSVLAATLGNVVGVVTE